MQIKIILSSSIDTHSITNLKIWAWRLKRSFFKPSKNFENWDSKFFRCFFFSPGPKRILRLEENFRQENKSSNNNFPMAKHEQSRENEALKPTLSSEFRDVPSTGERFSSSKTFSFCLDTLFFFHPLDFFVYFEPSSCFNIFISFGHDATRRENTG